MLSRIADSMFWMNRYLERSEGLLRMALTSYVLALDKGSSGTNSWEPVLNVFSGLSGDKKQMLANNQNNVIKYLLLDEENKNSLKIIINRARENARGMQDHITKEVWEQVNYIYHLVNNDRTSKLLLGSDQLTSMETMLDQCLLYTGVTDSTMPRGMGWSFMNLGKFIERCQLTLSVTSDYFYRTVNDNEKQRDILYWRRLLFTLSGYELHLKMYRSADTDKNVLDQVIFNRQFPHSVLYCLERIKKYTEDLIEQNQSDQRPALTRALGILISHIQYADQSNLSGQQLQDFFGSIQNNINEYHQQLTHTFFSIS